MAQLFRWLIAIVAVLVSGAADARDVGRSPRAGGSVPSGGFSPDGSFIEGSGATFSPFVGSATSVVTRYGTFTLGTYRSDLQPHWGGGDFYELFLNGHRITPYAQRVNVLFGGALIYSEEDENCWLWADWTILANGGYYTIGCAAPGSSDSPGPPSFSPPYTPSANGSTITAPSGTLTTLEGVWSWGPVAGGGGYRLLLNGTYIWPDDTQGNGIALQVNSNGHLFIQHPDSSWRVYLDYVQRPANTPTGQVIPTVLNITPGAGSPSCGDTIFRMPNASTIGTTVATLAVTMSDGSTFSGTASVGGSNNGETLYDTTVNLDGTVTVKTHQNPVTAFPSSANNAAISVTQNGTSVAVSTTLAANTGC